MICLAIGFTALLYIAVALAGYVAFCDKTTACILESFPASDNIIIAARIAICCVLSCVFPLFSHAIRGSIHRQFFESEEETGLKGVITTFLIVLVPSIIGVVNPPLDVVLGLAGAVAAVQLMLIIPAILRLKWILNQVRYLLSFTSP
jgi:hypothetical protein